jgi:hypothetical protein
LTPNLSDIIIIIGITCQRLDEKDGGPFESFLRREETEMDLKALCCTIFTGLLLVALSRGPAFAFRCGTKVVSIGDTQSEVINKCGEPDDIQVWEVERARKRHFKSLPSPDTTGRLSENSYSRKVHVVVEEWLYNRGRQEFLRLLRFENGKLTKIEIGNRGF